MNSTNNGYLAFDKVRIPRMQMLMKNAQVLKVNIFFKFSWYIFLNNLNCLFKYTYINFCVEN